MGFPPDLEGLNEILTVRVPTPEEHRNRPYSHPSDYGSRAVTQSSDRARPRIDADPHELRAGNDEPLDTIDEEHPAAAAVRNLIDTLLEPSPANRRHARTHHKALVKFLYYMQRDGSDVPDTDIQHLMDYTDNLHGNLTARGCIPTAVATA